MKVAYIVGAFPKPSEQFIVREVEELRRRGVEVVTYPVECGEGIGCPWCTLGKAAWLSIWPSTWRAVAKFPFGEMAALKRTAWRHYAGGLGMAARYARDIRARGIEHVHAHWLSKPADVGLMIAAMLRLPFTISAHAVDCFCEGVAVARKVRAASRVAVCNRAALEALASKIPASLRDRLVLIRHGIEVGQFEFRGIRQAHAALSLPKGGAWEPHAPVRVLAAGRLVEKKGLRHLIAAMSELPDCVCEIAGTGELEGELRAEIERRGLGGRARLIGWISQDEMRAKLAEADVLVVPSVAAADGDRDGVPNVLLEAGAAGLPIVASDAGGVGEFVIDGETGRLVPPGDPAAIAAAVRAAVSGREATRRLAENARKKVEEEYDLRENTERLMELFIRPTRGTP